MLPIPCTSQYLIISRCTALLRSLVIPVVRVRCGGVGRAAHAQHPHIPTPSRQITERALLISHDDRGTRPARVSRNHLIPLDEQTLIRTRPTAHFPTAQNEG